MNDNYFPGKDSEQGSLLSPEQAEAVEAEGGKFDIDLTLKLKPAGGKAYSIPICTGEVRSDIVLEALDLAMQDVTFRKVVKAACGEAG